jgi:ribosomal protein S14
MKNQKIKDQDRRRNYATKELGEFVIKGSSFLKTSFNQNSKERRKLNKCRIVNRCIVTYRDRAVFRKFQLTRGVLRQMLSSAKVSGFKKSSW